MDDLYQGPNSGLARFRPNSDQWLIVVVGIVSRWVDVSNFCDPAFLIATDDAEGKLMNHDVCDVYAVRVFAIDDTLIFAITVFDKFDQGVGVHWIEVIRLDLDVITVNENKDPRVVAIDRFGGQKDFHRFLRCGWGNLLTPA